MKRSITLKFIAGILVFFFIVNDLGHAAPALDLSALTRTESPRLSHIDIPPELATLEEWHESGVPGDSRLMLHIQDAHAQPEAQARIRDLIGYLRGKYGFQTVFVEGAAEPLNAKWLHPFDSVEKNQKWIEQKTQSGEMSGVDLAMLENANQIQALPIETVEGYRAGYQKLRSVYLSEGEAKDFLNFFDSKIELAASRILDDQTRALLAEWRKFENGHREFLPYIQKLTQNAKESLGLDFESLGAQMEWPQLTRLLVLQRVEKELQVSMREQAHLEKQQLIQSLKDKQASPSILQGLVRFDEKHLNLNRITTGNGKQFSSPRFLVEQLVEETRKQGIDLKNYPAFLKYAGYVILRGELQPSTLFKEITQLFNLCLDGIESKETTSGKVSIESKKKLITLYRDRNMLGKLLNLELSREEWQKTIQRKNEIEPHEMIGRLKDLESDAQQSAKKISEVLPVDHVFKNAFEFYDAAIIRENIFFEKISNSFAKNDKAILVTGGFHTEGLNEFFRQKGISYGTLMPHLQKIESTNGYRNIMLKNGFSETSTQASVGLAQNPDTRHAMYLTDTIALTADARSESRAPEAVAPPAAAPNGVQQVASEKPPSRALKNFRSIAWKLLQLAMVMPLFTLVVSAVVQGLILWGLTNTEFTHLSVTSTIWPYEWEFNILDVGRFWDWIKTATWSSFPEGLFRPISLDVTDELVEFYDRPQLNWIGRLFGRVSYGVFDLAGSVITTSMLLGIFYSAASSVKAAWKSKVLFLSWLVWFGTIGYFVLTTVIVGRFWQPEYEPIIGQVFAQKGASLVLENYLKWSASEVGWYIYLPAVVVSTLIFIHFRSVARGAFFLVRSVGRGIHFLIFKPQKKVRTQPLDGTQPTARSEVRGTRRSFLKSVAALTTLPFITNAVEPVLNIVKGIDSHVVEWRGDPFSVVEIQESYDGFKTWATVAVVTADSTGYAAHQVSAERPANFYRAVAKYASPENPILKDNPDISAAYFEQVKLLNQLRTNTSVPGIPSGMPINQTPNAAMPTLTQAWMRSSDIGHALSTDFLGLLTADAHPTSLDKQALRDRLRNTLQQVLVLMDRFELKDKDGRGTGILPEILRIRNGGYQIEFVNGWIRYSSYDMMLLSVWVELIAESAKGGIVQGFADSEIAGLAKQISDRTNYDLFFYEPGKMSRTIEADPDRIFGGVFTTSKIDNQATEARGFLPILLSGKHPDQAAEMWRNLKLNYVYHPASGPDGIVKMIPVPEGDEAMSLFTMMYFFQIMNPAQFSQAFNQGQRNYDRAAAYLGNQLGQLLYHAPSTERNGSYAQHGLNAPSMGSPIAYFMALAFSPNIQAVANLKLALAKMNAAGALNPNGWWYPDAILPETGVPTNQKRIFQNAGMAMEFLHAPFVQQLFEMTMSRRQIRFQGQDHSVFSAMQALGQATDAVHPMPAEVAIEGDWLRAGSYETRTLFTTGSPPAAGNSVTTLNNRDIVIRYNLAASGQLMGMSQNFRAAGENVQDKSWQIRLGGNRVNIGTDAVPNMVDARVPEKIRVEVKFLDGRRVVLDKAVTAGGLVELDFRDPAFSGFDLTKVRGINLVVAFENTGVNRSGQFSIRSMVLYKNPQPFRSELRVPVARSEMRRRTAMKIVGSAFLTVFSIGGPAAVTQALSAELQRSEAEWPLDIKMLFTTHAGQVNGEKVAEQIRTFAKKGQPLIVYREDAGSLANFLQAITFERNQKTAEAIEIQRGPLTEESLKRFTALRSSIQQIDADGMRLQQLLTVEMMEANFSEIVAILDKYKESKAPTMLGGARALGLEKDPQRNADPYQREVYGAYHSLHKQGFSVTEERDDYSAASVVKHAIATFYHNAAIQALMDGDDAAFNRSFTKFVNTYFEMNKLKDEIFAKRIETIATNPNNRGKRLVILRGRTHAYTLQEFINTAGKKAASFDLWMLHSTDVNDLQFDAPLVLLAKHGNRIKSLNQEDMLFAKKSILMDWLLYSPFRGAASITVLSPEYYGQTADVLKRLNKLSLADIDSLLASIRAWDKKYVLNREGVALLPFLLARELRSREIFKENEIAKFEIMETATEMTFTLHQYLGMLGTSSDQPIKINFPLKRSEQRVVDANLDVLTPESAVALERFRTQLRIFQNFETEARSEARKVSLDEFSRQIKLNVSGIGGALLLDSVVAGAQMRTFEENVLRVLYDAASADRDAINWRKVTLKIDYNQKKPGARIESNQIQVALNRNQPSQALDQFQNLAKKIPFSELEKNKSLFKRPWLIAVALIAMSLLAGWFITHSRSSSSKAPISTPWSATNTTTYLLFKDHQRLGSLKSMEASFQKEVSKIRAKKGPNAKIVIFAEEATSVSDILTLAQQDGILIETLGDLRKNATRVKPLYDGLLRTVQSMKASGAYQKSRAQLGFTHDYADKRTQVYEQWGPGVKVIDESIPFEVWLDFAEVQLSEDPHSLLIRHIDTATKRVQPEFFTIYGSRFKKFWLMQQNRDRAFVQFIQSQMILEKPDGALTERGFDHAIFQEVWNELVGNVATENDGARSPQYAAIVRKALNAEIVTPLEWQKIFLMDQAQELILLLDYEGEESKKSANDLWKAMDERIGITPADKLEKIMVELGEARTAINSPNGPMVQSFILARTLAEQLNLLILNGGAEENIRQLYNQFFEAYQGYWGYRAGYATHAFSVFHDAGLMTAEEIQANQARIKAIEEKVKKEGLSLYAFENIRFLVQSGNFLQSFQRSEIRETEFQNRSEDRSQLEKAIQAVDQTRWESLRDFLITHSFYSMHPRDRDKIITDLLLPILNESQNPTLRSYVISQIHQAHSRESAALVLESMNRVLNDESLDQADVTKGMRASAMFTLSFLDLSDKPELRKQALEIFKNRLKDTNSQVREYAVSGIGALWKSKDAEEQATNLNILKAVFSAEDVVMSDAAFYALRNSTPAVSSVTYDPIQMSKEGGGFRLRQTIHFFSSEARQNFLDSYSGYFHWGLMSTENWPWPPATMSRSGLNSITLEVMLPQIPEGNVEGLFVLVNRYLFDTPGEILSQSRAAQKFSSHYRWLHPNTALKRSEQRLDSVMGNAAENFSNEFDDLRRQGLLAFRKKGSSLEVIRGISRYTQRISALLETGKNNPRIEEQILDLRDDIDLFIDNFFIYSNDVQFAVAAQEMLSEHQPEVWNNEDGEKPEAILNRWQTELRALRYSLYHLRETVRNQFLSSQQPAFPKDRISFDARSEARGLSAKKIRALVLEVLKRSKIRAQRVADADKGAPSKMAKAAVSIISQLQRDLWNKVVTADELKKVFESNGINGLLEFFVQEIEDYSQELKVSGLTSDQIENTTRRFMRVIFIEMMHENKIPMDLLLHAVSFEVLGPGKMELFSALFELVELMREMRAFAFFLQELSEAEDGDARSEFRININQARAVDILKAFQSDPNPPVKGRAIAEAIIQYRSVGGFEDSQDFVTKLNGSVEDVSAGEWLRIGEKWNYKNPQADYVVSIFSVMVFVVFGTIATVIVGAFLFSSFLDFILRPFKRFMQTTKVDGSSFKDLFEKLGPNTKGFLLFLSEGKSWTAGYRSFLARMILRMSLISIPKHWREETTHTITFCFVGMKPSILKSTVLLDILEELNKALELQKAIEKARALSSAQTRVSPASVRSEFRTLIRMFVFSILLSGVMGCATLSSKVKSQETLTVQINRDPERPTAIFHNKNWFFLVEQWGHQQLVIVRLEDQGLEIKGGKWSSFGKVMVDPANILFRMNLDFNVELPSFVEPSPSYITVEDGQISYRYLSADDGKWKRVPFRLSKNAQGETQLSAALLPGTSVQIPLSRSKTARSEAREGKWTSSIGAALGGGNDSAASAKNWAANPILAERKKILEEAGIEEAQLSTLSWNLRHYPNSLLLTLIRLMEHAGVFTGNAEVLTQIGIDFSTQLGDPDFKRLIRFAMVMAEVAREQQKEGDTAFIANLMTLSFRESAELSDIKMKLDTILQKALQTQATQVEKINEETTRVSTELLFLKYWHVFRITPAEMNQLLKEKGLRFPRRKAEEIAAEYQSIIGIDAASLGREIIENWEVLITLPYELRSKLGGLQPQEVIANLAVAVRLLRGEGFKELRKNAKRKVEILRGNGVASEQIVSGLQSLAPANPTILSFIAQHARGQIVLSNTDYFVRLYNETLRIYGELTQGGSLVGTVNGQGTISKAIENDALLALHDAMDQLPAAAKIIPKATVDELRTRVRSIIEEHVKAVSLPLTAEEHTQTIDSLYSKLGETYRHQSTGQTARTLPELYEQLTQSPREAAFVGLIRMLDPMITDLVLGFWETQIHLSPEEVKVAMDTLERKVKASQELGKMGISNAEELVAILGISPILLAQDDHFPFSLKMLEAITPAKRETLARKAAVLRNVGVEEKDIPLELNSLRDADLQIVEVIAEGLKESKVISKERTLGKLYRLLEEALGDTNFRQLLHDVHKKNTRMRGDRKISAIKVDLTSELAPNLDAIRKSGGASAGTRTTKAQAAKADFKIPAQLDARIRKLMAVWQGEAEVLSLISAFFDTNPELLEFTIELMEKENRVFVSISQLLGISSELNEQLKGRAFKVHTVSGYIDQYPNTWRKNLKDKVQAIVHSLPKRTRSKKQASPTVETVIQEIQTRGQMLMDAGLSAEKAAAAFTVTYDINPQLLEEITQTAQINGRSFGSANQIKKVATQVSAYLAKQDGQPTVATFILQKSDWRNKIHRTLVAAIRTHSVARSEARPLKESLNQLIENLNSYTRMLAETDVITAENQPSLFVLAGNPNFQSFVRFVEIYKRDWLEKRIPILVTGGIGRGTPAMLAAIKEIFPSDNDIAQLNETTTEARMLELYLEKNGIKNEAGLTPLVITEGSSKTTRENYQKSEPKIEALFAELKPVGTPNIFIVTDMPLIKRAKLTADRVFNVDSIRWNVRGFDLGDDMLQPNWESLKDLENPEAQIENLNRLIRFTGYVAGFHTSILPDETSLPRLGEEDGIRNNILAHTRLTAEDKLPQKFIPLDDAAAQVREALREVILSLNETGKYTVDAISSERSIRLLQRSELRKGYALKQEQFYQRIGDESMAALSEMQSLEPLPDPAVLDISLDAGFREAIGDQSDFTPKLDADLMGLSRQIRQISDAYKIPNMGQHHVTLFEVFHQNTDDPDTVYGEQEPQLRVDFQAVVDAFKEVGPFDVVLEGLHIDKRDGTIFVKGYVESDHVELLRTTLSEKIPRTNWSKRLLFHVTLARLNKTLPKEQLQQIVSWVAERREVPVGTFRVNHPQLVAIKNHHATVINPTIQEKLESFNQQLRSEMRAISKEASAQFLASSFELGLHPSRLPAEFDYVSAAREIAKEKGLIGLDRAADVRSIKQSDFDAYTAYLHRVGKSIESAELGQAIQAGSDLVIFLKSPEVSDSEYLDGLQTLSAEARRQNSEVFIVAEIPKTVNVDADLLKNFDGVFLKPAFNGSTNNFSEIEARREAMNRIQSNLAYFVAGGLDVSRPESITAYRAAGFIPAVAYPHAADKASTAISADVQKISSAVQAGLSRSEIRVLVIGDAALASKLPTPRFSVTRIENIEPATLSSLGRTGFTNYDLIILRNRIVRGNMRDFLQKVAETNREIGILEISESTSEAERFQNDFPMMHIRSVAEYAVSGLLPFNAEHVAAPGGMSGRALNDWINGLPTPAWKKERAAYSYLEMQTNERIEIYSFDNGGWMIEIQKENSNLRLSLSWTKDRSGQNFEFKVNGIAIPGWSRRNPLIALRWNNSTQGEYAKTLSIKLAQGARDAVVRQTQGVTESGQIMAALVTRVAWKLEFASLDSSRSELREMKKVEIDGNMSAASAVLKSEAEFDRIVYEQLTENDRRRMHKAIELGKNFASDSELVAAGAVAYGNTKDVDGPKRALILPLEKPIEVNGIIYTAILLKGVLLDPAQGEWAPAIDPQQIGQTSKKYMMRDGKPVLSDADKRILGGLPKSESDNELATFQEFEGTDLISNFGFGKGHYTNQAVRGEADQRVELGYVALLVNHQVQKESAREPRLHEALQEKVGKIYGAMKASQPASITDVNELKRMILNYARLLRKAHEKGFHGYPHSANVSFRSQVKASENPYALKDFTSFRFWNDISNADRIGYLLIDLESIAFDLDVLFRGARFELNARMAGIPGAVPVISRVIGALASRQMTISSPGIQMLPFHPEEKDHMLGLLERAAIEHRFMRLYGKELFEAFMEGYFSSNKIRHGQLFDFLNQGFSAREDFHNFSDEILNLLNHPEVFASLDRHALANFIQLEYPGFFPGVRPPSVRSEIREIATNASTTNRSENLMSEPRETSSVGHVSQQSEILPQGHNEWSQIKSQQVEELIQDLSRFSPAEAAMIIARGFMDPDFSAQAKREFLAAIIAKLGWNQSIQIMQSLRSEFPQVSELFSGSSEVIEVLDANELTPAFLEATRDALRLALTLNPKQKFHFLIRGDSTARDQFDSILNQLKQNPAFIQNSISVMALAPEQFEKALNRLVTSSFQGVVTGSEKFFDATLINAKLTRVIRAYTDRRTGFAVTAILSANVGTPLFDQMKDGLGRYRIDDAALSQFAFTQQIAKMLIAMAQILKAA